MLVTASSGSASATAIREPQTENNSENNFSTSDYQSRALETQSRALATMKTQYQLDQQLKFLNLQAEAESLLQQLQAIKQQRQAATNPVSGDQPDAMNALK